MESQKYTLRWQQFRSLLTVAGVLPLAPQLCVDMLR
jgi:hypothetical protein